MTTKKMTLRRLAGTGGVLALVLAGAIGGAGMASATDGSAGPGQPGAPTSGTLVVHKYAGGVTQQPNDGTAQTVNRPPLADVAFEVTSVGQMIGGDCVALDLSNSADWAVADEFIQALDATPPTTPAAYCLTDDVRSGSTDASGVVSFSNLDLGLYYVEETEAPAGVVPSIAHYVTIPYANTSGSTVDWLYTVNTYPKNDLEGDGDKTVGEPTGNGQGATVPWTITTMPIGSFADGEKLTSYTINDTLDSRLTYSATPAPVLTYTTPAGSPVAVSLDDYSLAEPTGPGGDVVVTFTNLDWLNSLQAGTYFTFTFSTEVNGIGNIQNDASQYANGHKDDLGTARTQWGSGEILKHQAGSTAKTLEGATFTLYNSTGDACATLGSQVTINGETEFESNSSGIVAFVGLFVGNGDAPAPRVYCAVETVAPAGFILDTTPHALTVSVNESATAAAHIDVANAPVPGPTLPLTGADGTLWFTVGGIALIVVAAGGLLMMRRARSHE